MNSERGSKLALVTGAAAGLGLATTEGLLQSGWQVIMTDKNAAAGESEQRRLSQNYPGLVEFVPLDLSDLAQIAAFCESWRRNGQPLDALINNAGLFPPNRRVQTRQGVELGFGVSFYGHFALTAGLWPLLEAAPDGRVVCVSSIAHASGDIDLSDPKLERDYDCNRAYSASKLASLLFAQELNKRAVANQSPVRALAAHPGISRTQIGQYDNNPANNLRERAIAWAMKFAMRFLGQEAEQGAQPMVYAATTEGLNGGEFIGPKGFGQFTGAPAVVKPNRRVLQRHDSAALWEMAEAQTGCRFL